MKRITAAVTINRRKDLRLTMRLIEAQTSVKAIDLADAAFKLRSLLPR